MNNNLIKICGITRLQDALDAVSFGATALGFNFYPKSQRFIKPLDAQVIARQIPASVLKIGIFVNSTSSEIEQIARQIPLDGLQFHGNEFPEELSSWNSWQVIKAFRIKNLEDINNISLFDSVADYYLLDAFSEEDFGGTGKAIPKELINVIKTQNFSKPIIIAGGLNQTNISEIITDLRPFGVDVASGVETSPGIKDKKKVELFIQAAKSAFSS